MGLIKPLAFIPGDKFPSISITGDKCWLMCSYCRARYLHGMIHIHDPLELYHIAGEVWRRGGVGLLISGGFTSDGVLPIKPFLPMIKRVKDEFDLVISVHAGLVDRFLAEDLRVHGVDIIDYEFILNNVIIRDLKHLNKHVDTYIDTYEVLLEYGPPHIIPHIPIGFTRDNTWVFQAVDVLKRYKPELVVFLVSMDHSLVDVEEVVDLIRYARRKLDSEISLGCMRPYVLKPILDKRIIEEGLVDRIVNPLKKHIEAYRLRIVEACCSIPRKLVHKLLGG